MRVEKIKYGDSILAIIIRAEDWEKGLNFVSQEKNYLQVGFWGYDKGQKLKAHIHLKALRQINRTQEAIFIKRGKLRADIFTEKEKFFKSVELKEGDTAIFLSGGHGYEILEDDTQVLEMKNGPYPGPEKDKKNIDEKR